MRAKEFVINIPIHVTINGDGSVDVKQPVDDQNAEEKQDIMVPPPQQEIEIAKAGLGKTSTVIDQLLRPED
jgi:hypothetical protein